jgi:NAD(P)-dependent dehydrogenase (short-subunit alcohol dehydrogenase family)
MPERAALVTGASSGIGFAIARALGEEGYGLTAAARRPDKLAGAVADLRAAGCEVEEVAADMTDEADVARVVAAHRERWGRLDVLVNSAGVGFGAAVADIKTKRADMQLDLNLRAIVLFYRECADLLRAAGAGHRNALVVNLSSISGKAGQPWLSVYSATKAAVIGWTQAMNKELNGDGVKSVALCPGFVDTPMTEFVREHVPQDQMIRTEDIAEAVRFLPRTSPNCVVPEIVTSSAPARRSDVRERRAAVPRRGAAHRGGRLSGVRRDRLRGTPAAHPARRRRRRLTRGAPRSPRRDRPRRRATRRAGPRERAARGASRGAAASRGRTRPTSARTTAGSCGRRRGARRASGRSRRGCRCRRRR